MLVDNTNKIDSSKMAVSITLTISNEYKIFSVNIKYCFAYIPVRYYSFLFKTNILSNKLQI